MRSPKSRFCYTAILGLLLGAAPLVGCKKAAAPEPTVAAPTAPGSAEVAAAMAKKDYDAVVGALVKANEAATTPDQQETFRGLLKSVAGDLRSLGLEDPKAKEAFDTVSRLGAGR